MKTHELKQLSTQLWKAQDAHKVAREEVKAAQRKEAAAKRAVDQAQEQVDRLGGKRLIVSEHALLRYFERVLGYDLAKISEGLLTDAVRSTMAAGISEGKIPSVGCRLIVKENVVVSLEV